MITTKTYHTAIIGTGAAGLTAAIHLAEKSPDIKILIGTKGELKISSSSHAQGGIAVPWNVPFDNEENHIRDTMKAGAFKNDLSAVQTIISDARPRIAELASWGMPFDREEDGKLRLHREGGHSHNRVAHHGDQTGKALIDILIERLIALPNVFVMDGLFATDLILDENGACVGFNAIKKDKKFQVLAGSTILATGGIGQLYKTTTNPAVATGDGIAMAYRAGASVKNMAYIQFHPTAWYDEGKNPNELVTEAIRGEGAVLRNHKGEAFMKDRHPLADLAPRDIVARNIFNEITNSGHPHVWLDLSKIPIEKIEKQYPKLWSNLIDYRLDPSKDWIPVAPAAHYLCGGIETDMNGKTSIPNLYALGESAHTGFHGANRLASNSLLEGVVMAHRCVAHLTRQTPSRGQTGKTGKSPLPTSQTPPRGQTAKTKHTNNGLTADSYLTVARLQNLMQQYANVTRREEELEVAARKLNLMEANCQGNDIGRSAIEFRNMLTVGRLIIEDSLRQQENVGVFYKDKAKTSA